jgi:hypothetical protein
MKEKKITICKYNLVYDYYVRDNGTIYSSKSKKVLSPQLDKNGYEKVQMLSDDGKRHRYSVHRLILENFNPIENMENMQVNHIDGNKRNNSLNNLEWVTCKENIQHAIKNNLRAKINGASKLTIEQVKEIFIRSHNGESNISLGEEFNIHPDQIGRIKNRKSWKEVTRDL